MKVTCTERSSVLTEVNYHPKRKANPNPKEPHTAVKYQQQLKEKKSPPMILTEHNREKCYLPQDSKTLSISLQRLRGCLRKQ